MELALSCVFNLPLKTTLLGLPLALTLSAQAIAAPPTVIEPAGNNNRLAAGIDFATYELGDPWDMDHLDDIFTPNSVELLGEKIVNGIYTFSTMELSLVGKSKAQFWLILPGLEDSQRLVTLGHNPDTGRRLFTREKFPIDTSLYKHFTARVRMTSATATPLTKNQPFLVYYFENATSIGTAAFGLSSAFSVPPNVWTIVDLNLATDINISSNESWSLLPFVEGLRISPTNLPDVKVEIDWIRLTASPLAEQTFNVTWAGNGAVTYSVAAMAQGVNGATAIELLNGISATNANVSLSKLPSGSYNIEVTGNGETGVSNGTLMINDVPLLSFISPNIKGEQSLGYGAVLNSNPWNSIDPGDVFEALDFESFSYASPVGSLTGRPAGSDSRIIWETPTPVDTALFHAACFEFETKGPRDIGTGSVARIFWGNQRPLLTTTSPVIVQEGLNEYCVGDLANLQIIPSSSPQPAHPWVGALSFLRFDPHEFPRSSTCNNSPSPVACRDIRINSFILAPFHRANPNFVFTWNDSDNDDNAQIQIYLDDDRIPGNTGSSVEHLVGSFFENAVNNSFDWTPSPDVADGRYNVYAKIGDGFNTTQRYASGPVIVGAPPMAMVTVLQPNGVNDSIVAGNEYGMSVRFNAYDMDNSEFNLARMTNITNASLAGGFFTGAGINNDPHFTLMTTADGDPLIDPFTFRYLTIKLRVTGGTGPHFVQAFFSPDATLPPASIGFTSGFPINSSEWEFVTFDMFNDIDPASLLNWSSQPDIRAIRIDPTNQAGASFEIDWVTLSAAPTAATSYQVQWNAVNTGTSGFAINLIDVGGQRLNIATDLAASTQTFTTNLSKLLTGQYWVEVLANPGPVAVSAGPIDLVSTAPASDLIFKDAFE